MKTIAPLFVLIFFLLAMVIAAQLARAGDGRPWNVYQSNFLCCSFFDLSSAQSFVEMNRNNGNSYAIVFAKE